MLIEYIQAFPEISYSITDNSSVKFSELGTALKNCDAFIALKASSLKSFLSGVTENNINWDEFCIITKFPPAKGENSYTDKQFTDILELASKTGSSKEITKIREFASICY